MLLGHLQVPDWRAEMPSQRSGRDLAKGEGRSCTSARSYDTDEGITVLAALNEPSRRRLYRYVVGQVAPVSRDRAATALRMARSAVAFHLDKLVGAGLLKVEYHRPPGRGGPGAGRPTKLYHRTDIEIMLNLPERHYDLAGHLLARAVEDATERSVPVIDALQSAAQECGRAIGVCAHVAEDRLSSPITQLDELLGTYGYEPRIAGNTVILVNCPFHALAEEHRKLVCEMNHALISGIVEACGLPVSVARLDPAPDRCCVTLVV